MSNYDALRTAIAVHFWGKRVENNADKIADDLAPDLLSHFDITPKCGDEWARAGVVLPKGSELSHTPVPYPDHMKINIDRTELIPGGAGAMIGHSNAHPTRQFLIIPQEK